MQLTGIGGKKKKENKNEVKELIGTKRLKQVLEGWLDSINREEDFEVEVKGEKRRVPFKALQEGKMELEVESKNGENEFELELKWKGPEEETRIKQ